MQRHHRKVHPLTSEEHAELRSLFDSVWEDSLGAWRAAPNGSYQQFVQRLEQFAPHVMAELDEVFDPTHETRSIHKLVR